MMWTVELGFRQEVCACELEEVWGSDHDEGLNQFSRMPVARDQGLFAFFMASSPVDWIRGVVWLISPVRLILQRSAPA